MRTNKSAHQLIQTKFGFLDAYDPATPEVFEFDQDPSTAWVFHPLNPKGKDMLVLVKLNRDSEAKLVDRAEAITNFNRNHKSD